MANVILAAGGTGGHIFPALAVAEVLSANGHRVVLYTDKRGEAMVDGKITYRIISSASPFKAGIIAKCLGLASLSLGFIQSASMMLFARPAAVIGFGGYPSLAPILSGRLFGARCILHEQNAVMGRANRLLGKIAHHIALSFANTKGAPKGDKITQTGLPVRQAFAAISAYRVQTDKIHITIIGGSLGAQIFADIIPQAISALPASLKAKLHITQQARDDNISALKAAYEAQNISYEVARFYHDMPSLYEASDIIISRAGASSVQEIATAGRASLLVPFAGALDDHQTGNAMSLANAGGALVLAEDKADAKAVAALLSTLIEDGTKRAKMASQAQSIAKQNASHAIADLAGLSAPHLSGAMQ